MPLTMSFLRLPFGFLIFTIVGCFLLSKFPKTWFLILPILFFLTLILNKLFTFDIKHLTYSFDWEKIIITNPDNLRLIDRYWHEDLFIPYQIRNLFYSPWLLVFSWLNLIFKLLSPIFLVNVLGYSGFFLFFLGIIKFVKDKDKKWWPCWWTLTVVSASGLGMLVDSKNAYILAMPGIIYFILLVADYKNFNKISGYWIILFIIDLILK